MNVQGRVDLSGNLLHQSAYKIDISKLFNSKFEIM